MKIALIGASGFLGTYILKEALRRGHWVTAIVRHPDKISIQDPALSAKKGDVLNENEVAALTEGHDAVISAYNPGWNEPDIYNIQIKGYKSIINGVKRARVKRLLAIGGAGSLEVSPGKQLVDSPDFPEQWKGGSQAMRDVLNMLKDEKELNWTFLSPAITIQPGERTGKFRLGTDQPVMNDKGESTISAGDLAAAILDEIESPQYIRQRFTLGY